MISKLTIVLIEIKSTEFTKVYDSYLGIMIQWIVNKTLCSIFEELVPSGVNT